MDKAKVIKMGKVFHPSPLKTKQMFFKIKTVSMFIQSFYIVLIKDNAGDTRREGFL